MLCSSLRCHRQDQVRNATPQSTILVTVHPVKRDRMAVGEELFLKVVVHHLLHGAQTTLHRNLLLFTEQHCEYQERLLVGGVLMVAVAIENEGGPWGQFLEAVNNGHGLVSLKRNLQLAVDVQLHLVAVLVRFAGSIDVQNGGIEGRSQPLSQAGQRPLRFDTSSEDQTDWLGGLGRLEVLQQMDLAPGPQLRTLVRKLAL